MKTAHTFLSFLFFNRISFSARCSRDVLAFVFVSKRFDERQLASSIADTSKRSKILLWQHFAGRITPSVQRVVEFAKRVPGFCDFSQDDQLILIKLGFFEVWLSHVTKLSTDASLTFDDGTYLSRDQLELIYDVIVRPRPARPPLTALFPVRRTTLSRPSRTSRTV